MNQELFTQRTRTEPRTKMIGFKVTDEEHSAIIEAGKRYGFMSGSDLTRQAVASYINELEEKEKRENEQKSNKRNDRRKSKKH